MCALLNFCALEFFFLLITDSIFLLGISLFMFSISSWFSPERLCASKIYPFLLGCPICWNIIVVTVYGPFCGVSCSFYF